jgi:hypothetical protein
VRTEKSRKNEKLIFSMMLIIGARRPRALRENHVLLAGAAAAAAAAVAIPPFRGNDATLFRAIFRLVPLDALTAWSDSGHFAR